MVSYDVATKVVRYQGKRIIAESTTTFFDFLRKFMREHSCVHSMLVFLLVLISLFLPILLCSDPQLPFDFQCGLVGYLGYEMGLECGMQYLRVPEMREQDDKTREDKSHNRRFGSAPDSAFLFCDKVMVLDHEENGTFCV